MMTTNINMTGTKPQHDPSAKGVKSNMSKTRYEQKWTVPVTEVNNPVRLNWHNELVINILKIWHFLCVNLP